MTLHGSTVIGNGATNLGGGIDENFGTVGLANSLVTGNPAGNGGGIFNAAGTVSLSNTAVSGNRPNNIANG